MFKDSFESKMELAVMPAIISRFRYGEYKYEPKSNSPEYTVIFSHASVYTYSQVYEIIYNRLNFGFQVGDEGKYFVI